MCKDKKLASLVKGNKGFTLIELMVVVAIIAILSTIGISGFSSAQKKARDARRRADVKTIQSAMISSSDTSGNLDIFSAVREAGGKLPEDPSKLPNGAYLVVAPAIDPTKLQTELNSILNQGKIVFQGVTNNSGFVCARLEIPDTGNAIQRDSGNVTPAAEAAAETPWSDLSGTNQSLITVSGTNIPAINDVAIEYSNGTFSIPNCKDGAQSNCNLFCATF